MRINYNKTGTERKELIEKIAEFTGEKPVYLRMPTYSYQIGPFNLSRYGVLTWEDWADDSAKDLAARLAEAGFEGEAEELAEDAAPAATEDYEGLSEEPAATEKPEVEEPQDASEAANPIETESEPAQDDADPDEPQDADTSETAETEDEEDAPASLSISLPDTLSDEAFGNLEKAVASKQTLMRHAFKSAAITVERRDGKITFSGFIASDGDHTEAYSRYCTMLTAFAKEAKRVTSHDYTVENEKFAFRCYLLRIGMIGAEYKVTRKILLENLTGNSSWKNGAPKKAAAGTEVAGDE